MRVIDADALFAEFENADWYNNADRDEIAEHLVLQAPTIDAVSVVHGEWKVSCKDSVCSVCGKDEAEFICGTEDWYGYGLSNFCPNCGAKMDGERKGKCKECWYWSEVYKRCENKCGCQFKPYEERKESER